jgi:3D (Asp-Asp-Asp) domain-containing protein
MNLKKQRFVLIVLLIILATMYIVYGIDGAVQTQKYENIIDKQNAQLKDKKEQIEILEVVLNHHEHEEKIIKEYVGEFEITYYTAGYESCGKLPSDPEYGITASGTIVKEGQTIAADWDVLAPGTKVYIEGVGERIVEDKGGLIKGNAIDVYVENVEEALENGRHMANVYVLEEEK